VFRFREVLVEGIRRVDGLELFRRIFALRRCQLPGSCNREAEAKRSNRIFDNDLASSRVFCAMSVGAVSTTVAQ
jgi:hypothetical protein